MTKNEKVAIRKAIDLLLNDECYFQEAIILLGGLVGISFTEFERLQEKEFESVNVCDYLRIKKETDKERG